MIDMMILEALATDKAVNLIFAVLCLWEASGRGVRWCGLLGAAVYVVLALM